SRKRVAQPDELAGQRHHADHGRFVRRRCDLPLQQGAAVSTPRLCGTGLADVLWVIARDGVVQQPSILEQPRPLLDLDPHASELGRERFAATLWSWPGSACGRALCRVARTYDDWRGLGAEPGRSDVLFRTVGAVALGRILDSTRNRRSALGRSYEMPLQVTPVNRNLQTRVTFMLLELEDLFSVRG